MLDTLTMKVLLSRLNPVLFLPFIFSYMSWLLVINLYCLKKDIAKFISSYMLGGVRR